MRLIFAGSLLGLLVAATAWPQPAAPLDPTVSAVEIRLDQALGRPVDLESYLAFGPGDPLTDDAVRRTISNFHASGLFEEVEIFRRDEAAGTSAGRTSAGRTVAVVALASHIWVDSVEIAGEPGLRRELLLRQIEQRPGDPLVETRLLGSVYALKDLFEERGYREAQVFLQMIPRPGTKRFGVVFNVRSGPRARLGVIGFEGGLEPYTGGELRAMVGLEAGALYDRQRVVDTAERLRAALVKRGHLQASVGPPRELYDEESDSLSLVYPVVVGPEIRVEVTGADRGQLQRKGLLPFLDDQVYDQALVKQSREAIKAHFQRRGHYRVKVESREDVGDGRIDLRIDVALGPLFALEKIAFTGNGHVSEKELAQLMSTAPRQTFSGGRLVSEVLREDLANLRNFYVLQGFAEVEVGPALIQTVGESLELTVPIREGPRRRVVHLELPGVEHFEPREIRGQLLIERGGPFHPVLLEESVNLLRALYEEEGYGEVLVTPSLDWNEDGTLVDVELLVQEGRRSVVDRVILRGHRRTRSEVLSRFAGLEEGDTLSRRRLLEAERDLYRLGIFSRVDVDMAPPSDPSGRRDVVIRLDEGRRWRLGYGASYHSDDGLGGLLRLSRVNIGGRGDRLQLDLRANERDQRYRLIFDQPSLGRLNIPITYTLFRQDEERESFSVQDLGVQVALTKDLPRLRLGLTYDYRLVDLLEIAGVNLEEQNIPREDREVQISSLTPNLFIDRRDDPVDPTRGFMTATQLEYAFPLIQATANFAKLFVQQAHYAPLGRFGVFAASLRLGAIEPLDPSAARDPLVPPDLPSSLIPVSERFFAGGRTTHRAYERDTLGVPGETLLDIEGDIFESGGNGLLLANLDYRFPIVGAFGGTVFFDLGNVWADWRNITPGDLKPGMGVGFRYKSPIGPVRLEIGWKLDPEPMEDDSPVFFLSLGNPF